MTDAAGEPRLAPEWARVRLATISSFITKGSTPTTYGFKWESSGVLFLRSECVSDHGLDLNQSMLISEEAHATFQRSQVEPNDLLITITGNVGRVVIFGAADRANLNQHIARVRITASSADPRFVYFWLSQASVRRYFSAITTGQAYPQISLQQVRNAEVPLPPLPEQRAIAAALSDVDALLRGLDRLIAKKRDLKQAAMQQLLTGWTRLSGFHGEWAVKRLGSTAILKARIGWQGLTTAEYLETGAFFLVTGTEFTNGYIDWNSCHHVDESRYMQDKYIQLRKHDVLVTKDGTIGKVAIVTELPKPATLNSGVFVIRPIADAFHPEFFYYLLCSIAFKEFLTQLSAGSTINHLYQKDFISFAYKVPPTSAEQAAIAAVLSDMDGELASLEARRDKTRALKQGMMQELLTGSTRLI
ncbi:MAG: restriction endonuclease subunit S [Gemmatimonadaceae bacterium]